MRLWVLFPIVIATMPDTCVDAFDERSLAVDVSNLAKLSSQIFHVLLRSYGSWM